MEGENCQASGGVHNDSTEEADLVVGISHGPNLAIPWSHFLLGLNSPFQHHQLSITGGVASISVVLEHPPNQNEMAPGKHYSAGCRETGAILIDLHT